MQAAKKWGSKEQRAQTQEWATMEDLVYIANKASTLEEWQVLALACV